jgi:hypothetical protein
MNLEAQTLMRKLAAKLKESLMPAVELKDSDADSSDFDEPTALVCAALRPRPYSGAGAIALPEPDDHYPLT